MSADPASRTCGTCGFWSKWLPSCGDCMLFAYERHRALATDGDVPPAVSAPMTHEDETCSKWATREDVKNYVHDGVTPPSWPAIPAAPEPTT